MTDTDPTDPQAAPAPPWTAQLTAQLADVLAQAAEDHGTHDHHGQAAEVLASLAERGALRPPRTPRTGAPRVGSLVETAMERLIDERNTLARQVADALDERDTARRELADASELYAIADDDRTALTVALEDARAERRQLSDRIGHLRMALERAERKIQDLAETHSPTKCAPEEIQRLRTLLGLGPDDEPCGARREGMAPMTCLLPAAHADGGRWHQGLCGTWPL